MTLTVENPYLQQKRQLLVQIEHTTDKSEKRRLEDAYRDVYAQDVAWTREKLRELGCIIDQKLQTVQVMERRREKLTKSDKRKMYKQSCGLYKETMGLVDEIRKLKRQLREDLGR